MSKRTIIIPLAILAVAALLLFVISGHWNAWVGGSLEQKTDDAYVRADLVPLSTRISGTVRKMDVEDFQPVKVGQPLVQLDDDDYRAELEQAKAGLAAAQADLEDNQAAKRIQEANIDSAEAGPDLECHVPGVSRLELYSRRPGRTHDHHLLFDAEGSVLTNSRAEKGV